MKELVARKDSLGTLAWEGCVCIRVAMESRIDTLDRKTFPHKGEVVSGTEGSGSTILSCCSMVELPNGIDCNKSWLRAFPLW